MYNSPKVTVIIPNYNHVKYLPKRIDSVLQQTYSNIEVLILDDCSPDNSREVIDRYAKHDNRIQTVYNTQNSGSTFRQWSKGLGLATGKYVWIAESDDYADITLLEKLVAKLEADDEIGLAYCNSWYVYEETQTIELNEKFYQELDPELWKNDFVMPGIDLVRKFMFYRNIIPNASAVVMRKDTLDQVTLPDGSWKLVGDWFYWASLMAISKIAFKAEPLNYFRFHNNNVRSKSNAKGYDLLETLRMLNAIQKYGPFDPVFKQRVFDEMIPWWMLTMIGYYPVLPLKRNWEIYKSFASLDSNFKNRFRKDFSKAFFSRNFSGVRQLLGDGLLYPLIKKIRKKD